MKTITTALSGGLGNQMFQYALGRSLAERQRASLELDTRLLANDPLRAYALGAFKITGKIATSESLPRPPGPLARRLRRLPSWVRFGHQIIEPDFSFHPFILDISSSAYLFGNWQSEKYFLNIQDIIRDEFDLAEPFTPSRQLIRNNIKNSPSISVHVRRGDYVSNKTANQYHGTCEPEWYRSAKSTMDEIAPGHSYFIFSDDVDWARTNLEFFSDAVFIDPQADGKDHQDLLLMSSCNHHIIANSSYSWWAAWLNPSPVKKVVAPAKWFQNATHDTKDLVPTDWIKI